jgi:hypothetical protein
MSFNSTEIVGKPVAFDLFGIQGVQAYHLG